MKPGEKIRLIEQSQDLLKMSDSWARRMLALQQFGFDTRERDRYEGDFEYIQSILSDGPEDKLRELHAFLRGEDAEPSHRDDDQPWGDLPVRAFLSHIHEERHLVGEVKKVLAARYGVDAFVAHDDIHVSKKWREVIKAGLATCDMLVAFVHDGFHASQWCDQEAGCVLGRSVPIIVVRPEGVERRDGFLEEHQDFMLPSTYHGDPGMAHRAPDLRHGCD